jgi:hypothetical protein
LRNPQDIQHDLDTAAARRTELWARLGGGVDADTSEELERLSREIENLWSELRASRAFMRSGPPERIIARARAEERLAREDRRLRRVAA